VAIPFACLMGSTSLLRPTGEAIGRDARLACSAWSFIDAETRESYVDHLRRDLRAVGG